MAMKVAVLYNHHYAKRWQGVTFSRAVVDCLTELGYEATEHRDLVKGRRHDLIIAITRRALYPDIKNFSCPVVIYNNDPLLGRISKSRWSRNIRNLTDGWTVPNFLGVIDHLELNEQCFRDMRVANRVLCRHGYHRFFDYQCELKDQIHDVSFLGLNVAGKRRRILLDKLREEFEVWSYPESYNRATDHGANDLQIRDSLNSKIWLHIGHEFEEKEGTVVNEVFNQQRCIFFGLSNGLCVVSETCTEIPDGLVPGKHFAMTGYDELRDIIWWLINDDERRESIANAGYQWARSNPMIDHWKKAMRRVGRWMNG